MPYVCPAPPLVRLEKYDAWYNLCLVQLSHFPKVAHALWVQPLATPYQVCECL